MSFSDYFSRPAAAELAAAARGILEVPPEDVRSIMREANLAPQVEQALRRQAQFETLHSGWSRPVLGIGASLAALGALGAASTEPVYAAEQSVGLPQGTTAAAAPWGLSALSGFLLPGAPGESWASRVGSSLKGGLASFAGGLAGQFGAEALYGSDYVRRLQAQDDATHAQNRQKILDFFRPVWDASSMTAPVPVPADSFLRG